MSGLSTDEKAALLDEVVAEADRLCKIINVPLNLRPTAKPFSRYEIRIEVQFGLDEVSYRYVLWSYQRGIGVVRAEARIDQREAFLFDVFEVITDVMMPDSAELTDAEVLGVQEALMRRLNNEWGDAVARRHADYLASKLDT